LKFTANARTGTLVCRIVTPTGKANFELPWRRAPPLPPAFTAWRKTTFSTSSCPTVSPTVTPPTMSPPNFRARTTVRNLAPGTRRLRGIRDHLPYLQDLGVTTLWLTPVVKNGATEDYTLRRR